MEKVGGVSRDFSESTSNKFVRSGNVSGISGWLYHVLCMFVNSDAVTILESDAGHNTFMTYYSASTATAFELLGSICSLGAVRHVHDREGGGQRCRSRHPRCKC
jgi:hypothetical protein